MTPAKSLDGDVRLERLVDLLNEAVREAALNSEQLNQDPPVKEYFCCLCTAKQGSYANTWEEVQHEPHCLVSRAQAALSALRETSR